jgi:hypothetical protein
MTSLGYLQYSEINDNSTINSMTDIEKKKQARHNITIKKRHDTNSNSGANTNGGANTIGNSGANTNGGANANSENVQNMLKLINNSNGYDTEDSNGLADFNPPPHAEVSTKTQSNLSDTNQVGKTLNIDFEKPTIVQTNDEPVSNVSAVSPRQYPTPLDSYEGFNASPKYASDYYKQYVPYFNQPSGQNMNKSQILEKLNHMIHLLEEQRDEKTGHVMEEVILYSFLGVFIIFIIDSFARVGKYTR